jgi:hypothetical protein
MMIDPHAVQERIAPRLRAQLRKLAAMAGAVAHPEHVDQAASPDAEPQTVSKSTPPPSAPPTHAAASTTTAAEPEAAPAPALARKPSGKTRAEPPRLEAPWPPDGEAVPRLRLAALRERPARAGASTEISRTVETANPAAADQTRRRDAPAARHPGNVRSKAASANAASRADTVRKARPEPSASAARASAFTGAARPAPLRLASGSTSGARAGSSALAAVSWPEPAHAAPARLEPAELGSASAAPAPAPEPAGQDQLGTLPGALELDDFEERLADVLERAALEAGVDLS